MSSRIGNNFSIQIFGQSHSEAIGVVIDGLPANKRLDLDAINKFLKRRQGGNAAYSTQRREADIPSILSGLVNNKTCGAPLCAIFENKNTKSSDYDKQRFIPRPSHADYNAFIKYDGANDIRGGGHFSGRLTLPLCFAGAVCKQLLEEKDIHIGAHIYSVADIKDIPFNEVTLCKDDFKAVNAEFPVIDSKKGELMINRIIEAKNALDSVGGIIECAAVGVPQGLGEPMFDGIENTISRIVFGIPAIKGIEFGSGFAAASMLGSENNDPYEYENGSVLTKTNHAGGIIGGITTGMPVIFRAAVKPTPSIGKPQDSVNLETLENTTLNIIGRHDPCIVPRAVPCIEAAAAIALYDYILNGECAYEP